MKIKNRLMGLGIGMALLVAGMTQAKAQEANRVYTLLAGNTNTIAAAATNTSTTLTLACGEFDQVGLQASAKGHSGTPSNVVFYLFRSLNSTTYETQPSFAFVLQLNGTSTNTAVTNWSIPAGASFLVGQAANTNAGIITNVQLIARFKAPKQLPSNK